MQERICMLGVFRIFDEEEHRLFRGCGPVFFFHPLADELEDDIDETNNPLCQLADTVYLEDDCASIHPMSLQDEDDYPF